MFLLRKLIKFGICNLGMMVMLSGTLYGAAPQPSSTIPSALPSQPQKPAPEEKPTPLPPIPLPKLVSLVANYFHPGSIVYTERGGWLGTDNLLNLSNNIGIYVEILKPEKDALNFSSASLKSKVESIFTEAKISTVILGTDKSPPLPFYHVKIFLYPIAGGYIAFCEVRLFESVNLKRIILTPNMAYQAITWQRQTLLVNTTDKILGDIEKQVVDNTKDFVDIFKYYDEHKKEFIK